MADSSPAQLVAKVAAGDASSPRLAETCQRVLLTRIVQAKGRIGTLDHDHAVATFASPLRGLRAALRVQQDLAGLNDALPPGKRRRYRIGVGIDSATVLCARAEPGGICVDEDVLAAVVGKLDIESEDAGPIRSGSRRRALAVRSTLAGRIFRYKPWTTPGRRRASLILAGILIAAVVVAIATGAPSG